MSLSDIISDSVTYPFSDITKFLIIGVISLFAGLSSLFGNWGINNIIITALGVIISVIFVVVLTGYSISVTKNALLRSSKIPDLNLQANLTDGIKAIVISIIYYLIPIVITLFLAVFTGAISAGFNQIFAGLGVFAILAVIVFIIFAIFETVALARFADTGDFGQALNIGAVFEDTKRIGFGKIILFVIIALIILIIASLIISILAIIPFVGFLIAQIVIGAFSTLFYSRAIGLLYVDA